MKKKSTKRAVEQGTDPENPEWTRADIERAVSLGGLPPELQTVLSNRKRGAQKAPRKVPVSIRLSPDVVQAFRDSGSGWQSRVDEILRASIK